MLQTQPPARVGDTLPDFALPQLDGGELDVGGLRGMRLLLYFWGSW